MNGLLRQTQIFANRHGSTILTCMGGAGLVATAVMAVKATPKAMRLIEEAKKEKGEDLTKLEVVKIAGPTYIPAVAMGVGTLTCIFGANMLSKRNQAALVSAYALLDNSYKEYKKKVGELYGDAANIRIREEIAKDKYEENKVEVKSDKQLFFDEFSGRYFESTMADVIRAEYEINKRLSTFSGAYLNEFYELLDIPETDYGDHLGWSGAEIYDMSWESWLDFNHEKVVMDDGLSCYIISMSVDPTFGFEDY